MPRGNPNFGKIKPIEDLTSRKVGRLTVIGMAPRRNGRIYWQCRCECGVTLDVLSNSIRGSRRTVSCGCLTREMQSARSKTHGLSKTRAYRVWADMLQRCENPNVDGFKDYGGRGIVVCEEWQSFEGFLRDMGHCPQGMSLDRINVDGNYEPSNCRWATALTQQRNRRDSIWIEANGERRHIADWAAITGLSWATIYYRIRSYGWTPEAAVTTPVRRR